MPVSSGCAAISAAFNIACGVSIIAQIGLSPVIAASASMSAAEDTLGSSTTSASISVTASASAWPQSVSSPLIRTILTRGS